MPFLLLYFVAYAAYGVAVWRLATGTADTRLIWLIAGLALAFRAALLLTTPPTLSDDVYRYMWDGHITTAGVSPYAHAVNSPTLDPLGMPYRELVNHNWMASPYLPVAQLAFAVVAAIAPGSPLALQVSAVLFDLLVGLMVIGLLRRLALPTAYAAIYLWNPLVVVEFAHGAHVDSLMICLMMAALCALILRRWRIMSGVMLAAAALTKGIPLLLAPTLTRRWGWQGLLAFVAVAVVVSVPFVLVDGIGVSGDPEGVGLLGAVRIYASQWNFNSGLFHWLDGGLSGWSDYAGLATDWIARALVAVVMVAVLLAGWLKTKGASDTRLLRLMLIPLCAYLILTTTVHPWYVTIVIPLLPFLLGRPGAHGRSARFVLPWLAFAGLVALSYLTYLDPANLREYPAVRLAQYVPLYLLLGWAAWPSISAAAAPAPDQGRQHR
jgi:uncharacterized membrane protein